MTRYSSGVKNHPKDAAKVAGIVALDAAEKKVRQDQEDRQAIYVKHGGNREAVAKSLYEASRKRVGGRPPWEKLDPGDAYDMGMRDFALAEADKLIAGMGKPRP